MRLPEVHESFPCRTLRQKLVVIRPTRVFHRSAQYHFEKAPLPPERRVVGLAVELFGRFEQGRRQIVSPSSSVAQVRACAVEETLSGDLMVDDRSWVVGAEFDPRFAQDRGGRRPR